PGVVAKFAGVRNGVERPKQFAAHDVVGAQIAWRRTVTLTGLRAHDDAVFPDAAGRRARASERTGLADAHVNAAIVAAARDALAGLCVDRVKIIARGVNQAAILPVLAGPVHDAALRHDALFGLVRPDLVAGRSVKRHDRVVTTQHVHHLARDDRIEA